jgi:lysozyme
LKDIRSQAYHAYWDQWGKVWTVGYGETEGVGPNSTQTRAQAEQDLFQRLQREYEPAINALGVDFNQNQYDALCSFVWNLGPGSMSWDVGRNCRAKNFKAAADCMLEYTRAGGVVLPGLVRRRQAERALFLKPWNPPPPPDPHHYERYPVGPFVFVRPDGSKFTLNERGSAMQYDKLLAASKQDKKAIAATRAHVKILRDRVWSVAHTGNDSPSWGKFYRGWRWQRLNDRLSGVVKL